MGITMKLGMVHENVTKVEGRTLVISSQVVEFCPMHAVAMYREALTYQTKQTAG